MFRGFSIFRSARYPHTPMKRILPPALLVVLCTIGLSAQMPNDKMLDSLSAVLKTAPQDTNRIKTLTTLGFEWVKRGVMDTARTLLDEAITLADQQSFIRYKAKILNVYGISYFYQANTTEALKYWEQAKEIAETYQDRAALSKIQVNLANAQQASGNYPAALDLYLKMLHQFETAKDSESIAMAYGNIGVTYGQMDNQDKALDYLLKALQIDSTKGYQDHYLNTLINLSNTTLLQRQFEAAESYSQRALALSQEKQYFSSIGQSYLMLANVHMEQFHLNEAIRYLQLSNAVFQQTGDLYSLATNQGRLAVIYTDMTKPEYKAELVQHFGGDPKKALLAAREQVDSSLVIMQQAGDLVGQKVAYQVLSDVYAGLGQYDKALEYQVQFKMLSDSLLNIERDKKITQTSMQYEFDKQQAIAKAEQEKKDARQATIRNSIAGVLGGSLLFLFVVVRQRNKISREKQRSEELLLNILPAEVAEELKANGSAAAKQFDQATILFTDFKNFTEHAEKLSPSVLVEELNLCFKHFDELMQKYHIEKIKTIGDAYMAVGGLPDPTQGLAADVVRAALDMQTFMKKHKAEREEAGISFFEMRIGIHTGPVVAGIVGVKKFQYDIWGDTVNMAARMESSGEVGQVNISEATYQLIKDIPDFTFTSRGKIAAKGKGEQDMWFVHTHEAN